MKQNDICNRCGLSRHWSCTCHMPKHLTYLYKASLKQNDKKFESHSNTLVEANAKVNNALVMNDSNNLIDIKGLDVSYFFEDFLDKKIDHLIGNGVIGRNN